MLPRNDVRKGIRTVDRLTTSLGNTVSASSTVDERTIYNSVLTDIINGTGGSYPYPTSFGYESRKEFYSTGSYLDQTETKSYSFNYDPLYPYGVISRDYLGTSVTRYKETGVTSRAHFSGAAQWANVDVSGLKSTALRMATEDLFEKLRGDIDVGTDAGEAMGSNGAKTPNGSSGPWRSFHHAAQKAEGKAQKFADAVKATPWVDKNTLIGSLKKGSKVWLAWTYGLKPAIYSAFDASQFVISEPICKKTRGKGYMKSYVEINETSDSFRADRGSKAEVWVKMTAAYRVSDPALFDLTRMTSLNPAYIAWNRMPLSFVFDWFIDFGGWMRNMETALGMGLSIDYVETSTLVRENKWNHLGGSSVVTSGNTLRIKSQDLTSKLLLTSFRRTVSPSLPYAPLSLPGDPGFKFPWQRMLSGGALLSGSLPNKR